MTTHENTEKLKAPAYHDLHGRRFKVVAAFPEADTAAANAYMAEHLDTAVLAVHAGLVLLAYIGDRGAPTRYMTCSCCGASAGRHVQHSNRDTGYGLCQKCAGWLVREGRATPNEMALAYGVEGLNYEAVGVNHG